MVHIDGNGRAMLHFRLCNRLKVARAEKTLSQEELAALVGVTRQTISSIETCQYNPSALLALVLAHRLEKRVEDIFYLEGTKQAVTQDERTVAVQNVTHLASDHLKSVGPHVSRQSPPTI